MIYLNEILIKPTIFPDNTSQIWKIPNSLLHGDNANIHWEFQHEGELLHIAQLKDLINYKKYYLHIPYIPYARQDKMVDNYETFALCSFAKLLNALKFDVVLSLDVHSLIARDLIHNLCDTLPKKQINKVIDYVDPDIIVYPDAGAVERYSKSINFDFIYGIKLRDKKSGRIFKYDLNVTNSPSRVLIIDDICDGGATFMILTEKLKQAGAHEIFLYVTHGIFSKGVKILKDAGIKRIFTYKGEISEHQSTTCYRRL